MLEKNTHAVLLDTHVWVWLNEGSKELKPKVIKLIDQAAQTDGVFISAISVWEIAMLVNKKRLIFQLPIQEWVTQALSQRGVGLIPLLPSIAIESTCLSEAFHGDLSGRIIVASARIKNLTLITRDNNIIDYAKKDFLTIIKA